MTQTDHPFRHLLEPFQLGALRLRNRIVMTAHTEALGVAQAPSAKEIAYLAERARGGTGLIVTGGAAVHPTSGAFEQMPNPNPSDPATLVRFAQLADAIHEHGTGLIGQLYHCGGQSATDYFTDRPIWAPSQGRGMLSQVVAHAMTKREIREVVAAFASGAVNLQRAGFDGVEVHGGHGYLIQQFVSPLTNQRTDEYGGSPENRMRFAIEVLTAVREAVGADFLVGYRHSAVENMPGGFGIDGAIEAARHVDASRLADYLSVTNGTHESYEEMISSAYVPQARPAQYGGEIKPHVAMPVVAAGRLNDPRDAERLLADGRADLVGMVRAAIADPELGLQVQRGDVSRLRPCVGLNVCIARVHANGQLRCGVNPRAALEDVPEPAPGERGLRVAVVGAGPAGMEAAATAAERGCAVTLYEAGDALGGTVAAASAFAAKAEYARLVTYYARRLEDAGVELRLGSEVADVATLRADHDAVVVATGARWNASPWDDRALEPDLPYEGPIFRGRWQDLAALDVRGRRIVLVQAELGDHIALTLARHLLDAGAELHVVTTFPGLGAALDSPSAHYAGKLVARERPRVYAPAAIEPSTGTTVRIAHRGLHETTVLDDVHLLVSSGRRDSVPLAGAEGEFDADPAVTTAGDCVAPRGIAQAVREGREAAVRIAAGAGAPALAGADR